MTWLTWLLLVLGWFLSIFFLGLVSEALHDRHLRRRQRERDAAKLRNLE